MTKYINNILSLSCNCDNDTYTEKLSNSLNNSFPYLINNSNCYIGNWNNVDMTNYFQSLTMKKIRYLAYSTFMFDYSDFINNNIKCKIDVLQR